jgi:hypothetical protein
MSPFCLLDLLGLFCLLDLLGLFCLLDLLGLFCLLLKTTKQNRPNKSNKQKGDIQINSLS